MGPQEPSRGGALAEKAVLVGMSLVCNLGNGICDIGTSKECLILFSFLNVYIGLSSARASNLKA